MRLRRFSRRSASAAAATALLAVLGAGDTEGVRARLAGPATRGAASPGEVLAPSPSAALPSDIVLIVTDDQPWHTLSFMPRTNTLIGDVGVRFTNALASTPLCCPSRASILTGLFSHNHGVLSNFPPLGGVPAFDDASTVATWLRTAGYRTGLYGKYLNRYEKRYLPSWPYVPPGWVDWRAHLSEGAYYGYSLLENGTTVRYGTGAANYSVNVLARKAVSFIESTPAGQPLFVYFAPIAPHATCGTGSPCRILPPLTDPADQGDFAGLAGWRSPAYNEADVSDKPAWVRMLPLLTAAQRDSVDRFYRGQVESLQAVDRAVAAIVDALQRTGRLARTAIVFTADNGASLGAHRWILKNCLYEECVRVPLLVRAPGIAPRTDDHLILNVDLAPTIAAWAGVTPPGKVNGRSFAALLSNPNLAWRDAALLEVLGRSNTNTFHKANFHAVRTKRYVYAEYMNGNRELYDLAVDPHQLTNAVNKSQYAAVVQDLRTRLQTLKAE